MISILVRRSCPEAGVSSRSSPQHPQAVTLATWIERDVFEPKDLKEILMVSLNEQHLFLGLGEKETDTVFTRTFSMLIVAAVMSQFSAAVADTVGAGCLASEGSRKRLSNNTGYLVVSVFAIILIWTANLLEIISFASRAFALYYLLQCVVALIASRHYYGLQQHRTHRIHRRHFATVATILAFIVVFAIPAE